MQSEANLLFKKTLVALGWSPSTISLVNPRAHVRPRLKYTAFEKSALKEYDHANESYGRVYSNGNVFVKAEQKSFSLVFYLIFLD